MIVSSLASPARVEATKRQRGRKRRDIQGLRALAVMLVAVYHFFPQAVTGGFVGVDVFFVISGFLITGGLLKEVAAKGNVSLVEFYSRRLRRLMPAAVTVTVATLAVAAVTSGPLRLAHTLTDAAWTSAYLANFRLAQAPDGYFGTGEPSPFTHFWSLAVEEQFYFVWPLLVLVVVFLAGRRWVRALGAALAIVMIGSLVASMILTDAGSSHAYYSLGTRAWELGIGAALALLVARTGVRPSVPVASGAALLGLLAVLGAAFFFTGSTPFPGWTAVVPTLGTALVIWSGTYYQGRVHELLSTRPAQFLGDTSYSLYLWHWPVAVFAAEFVPHVLDWYESLALLCLSVVLGALSYYLVEQTTAKARRDWSPRRVIAAGLTVAVVMVAGPAVAAPFIVRTGGDAVARDGWRPMGARTDGGSIVFSPTGPGSTPEAVPANVTPTLEALTTDLADIFTDGCFGPDVAFCVGGDPKGRTTIVLAGDSHAGHWWPAADEAAVANGWKLFLVGMNGCPLANVEVTVGSTSEAWPECTAWQEIAPDAILELDPDLVVYANNAQGYRAKVSLAEGYEEKWTAGSGAVLEELVAASPVLYLGQFPRLHADPGTCLADNPTDVAACSTPSEAAVTQPARAIDVELARSHGAIYFDPTQLLCTTTCPVVDQNMIMYRDVGHLSQTYSAAQAPGFTLVIKEALAAGR